MHARKLCKQVSAPHFPDIIFLLKFLENLILIYVWSLPEREWNEKELTYKAYPLHAQNVTKDDAASEKLHIHVRCIGNFNLWILQATTTYFHTY